MDESRQTTAVGYRPTLYISHERRNRSASAVAVTVSNYLVETGRFGVLFNTEIAEYEDDRYGKVVEAIKLSDLVIIIYTQTYQSTVDCQREATIAADQKKRLLFIKAQPAKFKIEDWFYTLKGGRADVQYHNETDPLETLRAHLFEILGLNVVRAPSGLEIRKFRTVNIQKPQFYFERSAYEEEIVREIHALCACPEAGSLLVCGDGGVGKTTLLERVFSEKANRDFFLNDCKIRVAVWLNCFEWQNDDFGVKQQRAFCRAMLSKINARFGAIAKFTRLRDFVEFFKSYSDHAFFILDDVFCEGLLQYFRQLFPDTPCCVITRDPVMFTTPLYQRVPLVRQVLRVSELSENDVIEMLQVTFALDETLTGKQISALAQRCCGLPLIASLVAASLKNQQQEAYRSLMASKVGQINVGGPYGSVVQLFEFSLSLLTEKLRRAYYVFLLFDPAEPVSEVDLALLWGHDLENRTYTQRMCQLLADKSLIRKAAQKPTPDEDAWFIHQMLHEAALKHATETYNLSDQLSALSKVRLRIVTGRLSAVKSSKKPEYSTAFIIEAVKKRRLLLLSKIIEKLEAADLAELCRQRSPDSGGMTFLHYLYTVDWAVNRDAYFGASISYRLIKEIIFKLREFKVNFVDVVNQDRDPVRRQGKPKCLLQQIYVEKDTWRYTPDRNSLMELMGLSMQKLHEERKWEESFTLNESYRKFMDTLYARDGGVSFDAYINSYDGKALNKFEQGELLMAASRKGCLEVVVKLSDLFPNAARHKNRNGATPVMLAAANNHVKVVQYLCERYLDTALTKDTSGWNALTYATFHGNLEIVDLLVSKTPDPPFPQLIIMAAANGFLEVVEYFFDKKPENAAFQDEKTGQTALMAAARNGHFSVVEFLHLVHPNSVQLLDKDNWTALMYAASGGHIDSVEFLFHAWREAVTIADRNGLTPLMVAARYGHLEVVDYLFQKDPGQLAAKDSDGRTALMHAAASGHFAVINAITNMEAGACGPVMAARSALAKSNTTLTNNTLSSSVPGGKPGKLVRAEKLLATVDLS